MSKKCLGCGSDLQISDAKKLGYILEEKYSTALYCERCFRLKHYHEMRLDTLSYSNDDLLNRANRFQTPIYYFVDIINLNETSMKFYHQLNKPKTLVLTKIDLIPRTISLLHLIKRIKKIYNIEEDILTLSSKSDKLIRTLYHHLQNQKKKEILFLGMTNVGKSSFLNELYELIHGEKCPVLISEMPNTTLDFMKWEFKEFTLIDAPGFYYETSKDSAQMIKSVAKKFFKPITIQMKKETMLFFENTITITQSLECNSITFYGNNEFSLEKKYRFNSKPPFVYELNVSERSDFVLKGVGFFSIRHACTLRIYSKDELELEIRPSLFGGNYDND